MTFVKLKGSRAGLLSFKFVPSVPTTVLGPRLFSAGPMPHPPWLRSLLGDEQPPPKLYAWNISNLRGSNSDSNSVLEGTSRAASSSQLDKSAAPSSDAEKRRIYVLGIGNLGILFATALARLPSPPPITLVLHRHELLQSWAADPGLEITRSGTLERLERFDVEYWTDEEPPTGQAREVAGGGSIGNLLVTTKASAALPQVDRVRRYLTAESTVTFAQNGMCKLWPPYGTVYTTSRFVSGTQPNFSACVTTHGVFSLGRFKSEHASVADLKVGPVLLNPSSEKGLSDYLADQLTQSPELHGRAVPIEELWVLQLEKLVVNSIINPLTSVLRCKNGILFESQEGPVARVIDALVQEASAVLQALIRSPATDDVLGKSRPSDSLSEERQALVERFSHPQLKEMVCNVGHRTRQNTSSMLQDVQAGKPTEIRDFNGWILDTAVMLGGHADVANHQVLVDLVERGVALDAASLHHHFPALRAPDDHQQAS